MIDFQPIFTAVRQAAEVCKRVQEHHLASSEKTGHEPVTIADYGSQAILGRAISSAFPDDAVLAEESGAQFIELVPEARRKEIIALLETILGIEVRQADVVRWLDHGHGREAERTWVIDPIDGTKGFLAMRSYVIAAGVMVDKKPVACVIGAPAYPTTDRGGVMFHAQGGAAFMQPLGGGQVKRIKVSDRTKAEDVRTLESVEKSHANHERMQRVREAAGLGAASLTRIDSMEKYARIAAGDGELYLRLPRIDSTRAFMIWDHAAGTALVQAAGGLVTDIDGSPLDFSQGKALVNDGIIVSNGHIHEQVIAAVQKVLAEGE
ncbi:MAG: inositol monophosphatase family protein [Chloroflexota bacterium]